MATCLQSIAASDKCPNKFPNFISDICWSCMFPFRLWGLNIMKLNNEDFDTDANSTPVCYCFSSLKIGVPIAFWEPAYIVDVHMEPGCLPTLAGLELPLPWKDGQTGSTEITKKSGAGYIYRHSAYYVAPIMYLLESVLDDTCADRSPFDVGWTSEFDPTWDDDQLMMIKMPIAFAFGTLPAILASAPDAASAAVGFPIDSIFWHAGSWGPIYPLGGIVSNYSSNDQVGRLVATRMLAEAHAMSEMAGLFAKGSGRSFACRPGEVGCNSSVTKRAMCAGSPLDMPKALVMQKSQYKIQRIFPVPQTAKLPLGGCCSPIGRSSILMEIGTQAPTKGFRDFGYQVFRKRDCCAGVVSPASAP
nr:TraU family protein [Rhodoferax antarcticus]